MISIFTTGFIYDFDFMSKFSYENNFAHMVFKKYFLSFSKMAEKFENDTELLLRETIGFLR